MKTDQHEEYMELAIRIAAENIDNGNGGPFGAVVVKNGKIIAASGNKVTSSNDPTAHAEVVAIREACQVLHNFDLTGCTIYASCEPCPMCLAAIMWARIDGIFYAADRNDAAFAGFDDEKFYDEFARPSGERLLPAQQILQEKAVEVFSKWIEKEDKIHY